MRIQFLLLLILLSCNPDDDPVYEGLEGTWVLIEYLADPGSGTAPFQPIDSDFTLNIASDNFYSANASFCDWDRQSGNPSSGFLNENTLVLTEDDCDHTFWYEQNDNELVIRLLCIEPCALKFARVGR